MKTGRQRGGYLPNAPLQEAVVSLRWALDRISERIRYDSQLDLGVGRLEHELREAYPVFERILPPFVNAPLFLNYQPTFRFRAEDGYPLVQLGSGILTVNQSGRKYEWTNYLSTVSSAFDALWNAYGDENLQLDNLRFLLVNRLELKPFEAYLRTQNERENSEYLKVSEFFAHYLKHGVETSLGSDEYYLLGQDIARTYRLPDDLGVLVIRFRDDSEPGADQIAYWEIEVSTSDPGLQASEAVEWLGKAHDHTHRIFERMCADPHLARYFAQAHDQSQ